MSVFSIAFRELNSLVREKSFGLLLLIELLLVTSSGLLSVGYVIMTSPESSNTLNSLSSLVFVGVVTNTPDEFDRAFRNGRVHYTFYRSYSIAKKDFREGLIDAVIFGDIYYDASPTTVQLYLPSNSPKADIVLLSLKKVFLSLETEVRDEKMELFSPNVQLAPYTVADRSRQARYVEIYYIFTLPLLLFLPSVISGSLSIDSITQDLESKTIINLLLSPLTEAQIVLGKALAPFIISVTQSLLWLMILWGTILEVSNPVALMVACTLYTLVFLNVGTTLALAFKKMKSAQIVYTFFSMTAVSLFSPFANLHPILLRHSPSYVLTRIALGASWTLFTEQFLVLAFLVSVTAYSAYLFRKQILF